MQNQGGVQKRVPEVLTLNETLTFALQTSLSIKMNHLCVLVRCPSSYSQRFYLFSYDSLEVKMCCQKRNMINYPRAAVMLDSGLI